MSDKVEDEGRNYKIKDDGYVDKEDLKRRLREQAQKIKIRGLDEKYLYDDEHIEK